MIILHTPACQEHPDAKTMVVFIHGFMGSPNQFIDLAAAAYENSCSYVSVLLPGHGVHAKEFMKSAASDWERHVQNEIESIKDRYEKIFLVGHSMGGLIALNVSLDKENKIAGIFMISTPLKLRWFHYQSLFAKLRLLTYPRSNEVKSAYLKSNSIAGCSLIYYPLFVKPFMSFYQLVRKTKNCLAEVFVPVYIVHSKNDETTSYKSAKLLYDGLCNAQRTAVTLDKSWHAFFTEQERRIISETLNNLIAI